jgi:heme o synthase
MTFSYWYKLWTKQFHNMMQVKNLSLLTLIMAFALLLMGGLLHSSGASLSCPDWPLCYGQAFPYNAGTGMVLEMGHRWLGALVGLLTLVLTIITYRKKDHDELYQRLFPISATSLLIVIVQGSLGGLNVYYKLPTLVSTSHFVLSLVFFGLLMTLFHQWEKLDIHADHIKKRSFQTLRDGHYFSLFLLFVTLVVGAIVRHTGAQWACGSSSFFCYDAVIQKKTFWPSFSAAQLHMFHRALALAAALFASYISIKTYSFLKKTGAKRRALLPLLSSGALLFYIFFGIISISKGDDFLMASLHSGSGVMALALLWLVKLDLKKIQDQIFPTGVHGFWSDFLEMAKPRLALLVMMTVFVGFMAAPAESIKSVGFFNAFAGLVLIFMVVAGAAILNCYMEKEVDKLMERTKNRPLPAGRMRSEVALGFGLFLLIVSLPLLVVINNFATAILGFIAAALYLLAYTPLKQRSEIALYIGAIPGAIPPVMGWTMATGEMDVMAWCLFSILFIWQIPHFLAIGVYLAKDYESAAIKIYPNSWGESVTKWGIFLFTLVLFGSSLSPYYFGESSREYFWVAMFINSLFLILAFRGLFIKKETQDKFRRWARHYFLGSVIYLPLILGALIFLRQS